MFERNSRKITSIFLLSYNFFSSVIAIFGWKFSFLAFTFFFNLAFFEVTTVKFWPLNILPGIPALNTHQKEGVSLMRGACVCVAFVMIWTKWKSVKSNNFIKTIYLKIFKKFLHSYLHKAIVCILIASLRLKMSAVRLNRMLWKSQSHKTEIQFKPTRPALFCLSENFILLCCCV